MRWRLFAEPRLAGMNLFRHVLLPIGRIGVLSDLSTIGAQI